MVRFGMAVMMAAVVLAAVVRFAGLGADPLDAAEASQSVAAWWTVKPPSESLSRLEPRPESALLLGLDTAAFWVIDSATDLTARWVPALAGVALVALALLLLRAESPAAAAPVVVLLAVDPWLIALSRRASGAILGAGAAVVCYLVVRRLEMASPSAALAAAARRQWRWWAASAGLLLVSGGTAWDFLPPVLFTALMASRGASLLGSPRPSAGTMCAAAAIAAVAGATSGLVQWRGPALLSSSLESWLASWTGSLREMSLTTVAHASAGVVLYQVLLAALAGWGLWRAWNRSALEAAGGASRTQARMLLAWLAWGAVMQLRSGGAGVWLALEVPMLLAAALALADLLARVERADASVARRVGRGALAALAVLAAVAGAGGVPRPAPALPAARRLAGDILTLLERPVAERPSVEVVTGPRIDGLLAWYLREVPARWIASAADAPEEPGRIVVVSTVQSREQAATAASTAPRYVLSAAEDHLQVVELR